MSRVRTRLQRQAKRTKRWRQQARGGGLRAGGQGPGRTHHVELLLGALYTEAAGLDGPVQRPPARSGSRLSHRFELRAGPSPSKIPGCGLRAQRVSRGPASSVAQRRSGTCTSTGLPASPCSGGQTAGRRWAGSGTCQHTRAASTSPAGPAGAHEAACLSACPSACLSARLPACCSASRTDAPQPLPLHGVGIAASKSSRGPRHAVLQEGTTCWAILSRFACGSVVSQPPESLQIPCYMQPQAS